MIGQEQLMSSARTGDSSKDEWATPSWLWKNAAEEFLGAESFTLDAAATKENRVAPLIFTKENSALVKDARWDGHVWCNPPYSMLRKFAEKAISELRLNKLCQSVTFLIPARTDTIAFHALAECHFTREIIFLKGRVTFVQPSSGPMKDFRGLAPAPFPSALVHMNRTGLNLRVRFKDWRL